MKVTIYTTHCIIYTILYDLLSTNYLTISTTIKLHTIVGVRKKYNVILNYKLSWKKNK